MVRWQRCWLGNVVGSGGGVIDGCVEVWWTVRWHLSFFNGGACTEIDGLSVHDALAMLMGVLNEQMEGV